MYTTDHGRMTRDDTGSPKRTKIASFYGSSFLAERGEGNELVIYHVSEDGISSDLVGDARRVRVSAGGLGVGGMSAKQLQAMHERRFPRGR